VIECVEKGVVLGNQVMIKRVEFEAKEMRTEKRLIASPPA